MVDELGLLGAGAQADEIAAFARPQIVAFRAVQRAYLKEDDSSTLDIAEVPSKLLQLPVVAAVGGPGLKRELVLAWGGHRFQSVRASDSWIDESASIADGTVIAPGAVVSVRTEIGPHVLVNLGASVSHDTLVGAYATISPGVHIAGGCRIGDGVFLGIGAIVSDGVSIAPGSVIGAGAVVLTDIDECGVYVGAPARIVRKTEEWLRVI